jgi:hypothetical protein
MGKSKKSKAKVRENPTGLPSAEQAQQMADLTQNTPIEQNFPVLEQVYSAILHLLTYLISYLVQSKLNANLHACRFQILFLSQKNHTIFLSRQEH